MLNILDQRAAENDSPPAVSPREAASDDESRLAANAAFWRGLPARAAGVRHLSLPADPAENDIVDPFRRPAEVYREMEDQLAPAIVSILRHARLNAPVSPNAAQL